MLDGSLGRAAASGLQDHRVNGRAIFPAAAYLELAAAAADILTGMPNAIKENPVLLGPSLTDIPYVLSALVKGPAWRMLSATHTNCFEAI